jgi:3-hydroxyisobutyrate dehydrogenase-like beta-hydroxyacid dehydrogenase
MARIGFLGLGLMGTPMARRLLGAGHDVTVWNRTPERAAALSGDGAKVAATPAEAAAGNEIVITMLTDRDALEAVLFGPDGAAKGLERGTAYVDMSTVGRDAALATATWLPEGVEFLDAPVVGSTPRAEAGGLTILVGGSPETFERVRPVLEVMGKPSLVGGTGAGASMKLVLNSTLGAVVAGVGEGLALGIALGLDKGAVLDALENSYLGAMVKSKRQMIDSATYPAQFKLSLAAKDLRLVEGAARDAGRTLAVATTARGVFDGAEAAGFGDDDFAALVEYLIRD